MEKRSQEITDHNSSAAKSNGWDRAGAAFAQRFDPRPQRNGDSTAFGRIARRCIRIWPESSPNFRRSIATKTQWKIDDLLHQRECSVAAWFNESRIQKRRSRQSAAGQRL